MVTLLLCSILWWRIYKSRRFALEYGRNFLLGNQQLLSHSIQIDLLLSLELHIMG